MGGDARGFDFMRVSICLAVAVMATGCGGSGKPILFILPAGFRGEFQIVKDSVGGSELVERNGQWAFEIPSSGVLRVNNDRPFYRWHATQARYSDGRNVTIGASQTTAGFNASRGDYSTEYDGTTHVWRVP